MTRPHYLNGRILHRDHGGIRRYTAEVAAHLSACTLVEPKSANYPWSARLWEQTTLARASADGVLLNTAHGGPLRHRHHVTVVHDLLALTSPRSVHPAFAALTRWQLPRLITSAKHVVTVSTLVADQLRREFDLAGSRLSLAPPGISEAFHPGSRTAARERLGLKPDQPVIAALLDPTPRKNANELVGLLHQLMVERSGVQIVVAGRAAAPAFARQRAKQPTNHDSSRRNFLDLGEASDEELASAFQAADVFVSLTRAEGFGMPAVEAASCGAAVVTTPVPSISEHAPDAALTVSPAEDVRKTVLDLLDNPARRQEMAAAAKEQLGDLLWTRTAATLDELLIEVGLR